MEENFDISAFINDQKWILTAMGVFAAIALQLMKWPEEPTSSVALTGVVASLLLFGFMAYILTKNLIGRFDGWLNTLRFLFSFRQESFELLVFLTLLYSLCFVVVSLISQVTVGVWGLLKVFVFLLSIFISKSGIAFLYTEKDRHKLLSVLIFITGITLMELANFHFPIDIPQEIAYILVHNDLRAYLVTLSLGMVVPILVVSVVIVVFGSAVSAVRVVSAFLVSEED